MSKKQRFDYVTELLTGKFEKVKNEEGRIKEEFVPSVLNKYPPLGILYKNHPELSINDILARQNLIHNPIKINRNEFKKEILEKAVLKKIKREHRNAVKKAGFDPRKRLNIAEPFTLKA